jgi:hypothetical protein
MGFLQDRTLIILVIIFISSIVVFGFFFIPADRSLRLYDIIKSTGMNIKWRQAEA